MDTYEVANLLALLGDAENRLARSTGMVSNLAVTGSRSASARADVRINFMVHVQNMKVLVTAMQSIPRNGQFQSAVTAV